MSKGNKGYSLLQQACIECCENEFKEYEQIEKQNLSKRYKRRMNRIGREKIGLKNALHPEVDNIFERARSNMVYWCKTRKNKPRY